MNSLYNIDIKRNAKVITHPFFDYFKGFEEIEAVQNLFGDNTLDVLKNLRVEFFSGRGYMGVDGNDGHIHISAEYLNKGNTTDIYLDIIHELVHVKQFLDGKELRDRNYRYVERPTEIEAYRYSVNEARRLGLDDKQIVEYLQTERMSEEDLNQLAKTVNVRLCEC
jgi:hypothetical protein